MLPEIFNDPRYYAVLVVVIVALIQYQRTLSWAEYKRIHRFKLKVLPVIDRHTNLFVVSRKGGVHDPEFVGETSKSIEESFKHLVESGGSPHLINSLKLRAVDGGKQFSPAQVVFSHSDGSQTEVYLFPCDDGTHAYAHVEPGPQTPKEHLEGWQKDGDVRGVIPESLF